jgi:hypothetical protein
MDASVAGLSSDLRPVHRRAPPAAEASALGTIRPPGQARPRRATERAGSMPRILVAAVPVFRLEPPG